MLKKLLAMAAASVMMLSCFGGVAQAEYEYTWGEKIAYEGATTNSYEDAQDSQVVKRMTMNGANRGSEADATYYYLFKDNKRNTTSGNLRLSNGNTQEQVFKVKGKLIGIDNKTSTGADISGHNFYSVCDDLYARVALVDSQAATSAGINTVSQKNVASTMTYEFDVQYNTNFFGTIGYVSTHLSGSFSGRNIPAVMIDNAGKLYSTGSNFASGNAVEIGQLTPGTKHKISVVVELNSAGETNKYNYVMEVYLDGVKKFYTQAADSITAANTRFYGFEFDLRPWTVDTDFSATTAGFTGTDDGYYGQNSSSKKLSVEGSDLNEYTLINTDTTISDFTVYAGNKYAENAQSLSHADSDFYISSNERNNTNYVTVAAQTASDDSATSAKAILATYDSTGKLANVVSSPAMTLIKGGIAETDIELTNEGASTKKLFIFDSLGNLKPLTADIELD